MNKNFHRAKKAKNDEFYTQLSDIEKELQYYKKQFRDKIIYLNCDSEESHFWKYFTENFQELGLKKLIATHRNPNGSYRLDYDGTIDRMPLTQKGDFRSDESIKILEEADIVCTNPPFSLFREYVGQLVKYNKDFLIIGPFSAISFKAIFGLIKENKLWQGVNSRGMRFRTTKGEASVNACWFTNLEHKKEIGEIKLSKKYDPEKYPKYDNYDAIEVSRVVDIPYDYEGIMGVPITFLDKYNPNQFEICGNRRYFYDTSLGITGGKLLIKGKETYDRIFIRRISGTKS